jgi:uncharacterized HAD superfamily protein
MIIGVDLDDVLLKTSNTIVSMLERNLGVELDWENISDYSISKSFDLDKNIVEQHIKLALESDIIEPEPNAVKIFNWISDLFPTFIVSRREHYLYDHTLKVLDKLGFSAYRLITFHDRDNGSKPKYKDKDEIVNKYGIELFVEDRPSTIRNIYNNTGSEILIYDKPWNKIFMDDSRIRRVHSWTEIREYILWRTNG